MSFSIDCDVEEETKAAATCDLCGKPPGLGEAGRIYSFTGASWIKLHVRCLGWMGLQISGKQGSLRIARLKTVTESVAKSRSRGGKKPNLRLVRSEK